MRKGEDMNELLMKLVNGKQVTDKDIADELHDVCERVHSGCTSECPVFEKNHGIPWNEDSTNCMVFKDGYGMLEFMRYKDGSAMQDMVGSGNAVNG